MRYVSLFSGIEAASVAWEPLGWTPLAFCEIDDFPCRVLAHRFPEVPNLGDVTKVDWHDFKERNGAIDVVVGGSPCQSFSVAGDRTGLDGASGLMWEYVRCVRELAPRYAVWENVPGALSSTGGADFRCLLEALDDCGYSCAWRVLDAQFYGVAQRRRRVFLVAANRAAFGDSATGRAAAVLLERDCVSGNTQSGREKRQELAAAATGGVGSYCIEGGGVTSQSGNGSGINHEVSFTLNCTDLHAVSTLAFDESQVTSAQNGNNPQWDDPCHTLSLSCDRATVICMADSAGGAAIDEDMCGSLMAHAGKTPPW